MADDIHNVRDTRIAELDADVPESLIELDGKLKKLLHVVDAKLKDPLAYKGNDLRNYIKTLTDLEHEIEEVLSGVFALVDMLSDEDLDSKKSFYQSEELNEFNKLIAGNMEKFEKMQAGE